MDKQINELRRTRKFLTWILGIASCGLTLDLFLIAHYETIWQLLPIALLSISIMILFLTWLFFRYWLIKAQFILSIMVTVTGLIGSWLHFQSNMDFELEMYPDLSSRELIWNALTGALPVMAPCALIPYGLTTILLTKIWEIHEISLSKINSIH